MKFPLNPEQQEAVDTTYGPILVLAGAGSGKTRVVTCRIINLLEQGVDPSTILAVTFTNKAAMEMKERVNHLTSRQVLVCTFHSLGARILREIIHVLGFHKDFTIYDDQDVEKIIKLCLSESGSMQEPKTVLSFISKAKNALTDIESLKELQVDHEDAEFFDLFQRYQQKLFLSNAVDFDDLLYLPVKIFRAHADVLDRYQKRWNFLMIDEYQDTNETQSALIRLLVEKHNNLCVVGDPDQSIYSWRGANIDNILSFSQQYANAKVIRLEQNYRSRTNILEAANALISGNAQRYEKSLWSDRGPGAKIVRYTADTEREEALFVAERMLYHHTQHNIPLNQMAVFYRTNAQSRPLEDKMIQGSIPYVIVGGVSFYQRREIKDILAFLRMVYSGNDYVSFIRSINLPKRGIGDTTIEKIRVAAAQTSKPLLQFCSDILAENDLPVGFRLTAGQRKGLESYICIINELKEIAASCSLQELVNETIHRTGYLGHLEMEKETYQERRENLNALVNKAREWELSTENPSLQGFLEELSLKSSLDEAADKHERIHLMTIHNHKGLEFDVVFLVGLEEDLFPHANSRDNEAALEEERRLCYVGMTRAKEFLYLCDVRQRFLWGVHRSQRPSRFLYEIPAEYTEKFRHKAYY